jgi:MYXO-CTERM domain-containing protein
MFLTVALAATAQAQAAGAFVSASAPSPPGTSPGNPVLPNSWNSASNSGRFQFAGPTSGLWFDPPMVEGFTIAISSGSFLSMTAAPGFSGLKIRVDGSVVDSDFNAGETYTFSGTVLQFDIFGITPALDGGVPTFATAFPLQLSFSGTPAQMTWTNITAVPETSTFGLTLMGLVGLGLLASRRPRQVG